jgi:eukaryotic-like serine/threonine-protein kinase
MLPGVGSPSHLKVGARLGRYELLVPIGIGGMAQVWRARIAQGPGAGSDVAVKTILPQVAAEADFRIFFLDEARLASRIRHENVVNVMDLGDQDGQLYMVMEYVPGETVDGYLDRLRSAWLGNPPLEVALMVCLDAARGLHAAHEVKDERGEPLGLVHRDVSPQNLMITTTGVTKIIDFGVAKARDRLSKETAAGIVKGKLAYMGPEHAAARKVDRRADVWSLGAVLFELVSGRTPYEYDGNNAMLVLKQVVTNAPRAALPPGTPAVIAQLLDDALAFDADRRLPSCAALAKRIEDAAQSLGLKLDHARVSAWASAVPAFPDAEVRASQPDLGIDKTEVAPSQPNMTALMETLASGKDRMEETPSLDPAAWRKVREEAMQLAAKETPIAKPAVATPIAVAPKSAGAPTWLLGVAAVILGLAVLAAIALLRR